VLVVKNSFSRAFSVSGSFSPGSLVSPAALSAVEASSSQRSSLTRELLVAVDLFHSCTDQREDLCLACKVHPDGIQPRSTLHSGETWLWLDVPLHINQTCSCESHAVARECLLYRSAGVMNDHGRLITVVLCVIPQQLLRLEITGWFWTGLSEGTLSAAYARTCSSIRQSIRGTRRCL